MKLLVTGSSGLVGSDVCAYFASLGWQVHGVDNNQRTVFFGPEGDTRWNQQRLEEAYSSFVHHEVDIRNRTAVLEAMEQIEPAAIVHAAAQPSHDLAAKVPFDDFDTNAVGTLNLLEATRRYAKEAPFVYLSTNKVYGDAPNRIALRELETRWDYEDAAFEHGIAETFPIDQSKHSLFGASKLAADVMTQEYGRYFGMPTCCLRGGCLTGPNHSGVELHGFLSYLVRCAVEGRMYKIYGYKGKQVRDNLHSLDVARFIQAFVGSPRSGEVYNIGGGKQNSCSIVEAFEIVQGLTTNRATTEYVDTNRIGDYVCYYSDLRKMRSHYPGWDISVSLEEIFEQLVASWSERLAA